QPSMNPHLERLQPYPFQKLQLLLQGASPNPAFRAIDLSIGEPKHATPPFILEALAQALSSLARYPTTAGQPALRLALADWIARRYAL
ncbi:aminotransferase class I/II-fold pyridoxal phosphate-dependent enzyme, partial [Pelomicrobium sp. G1]|uniref:aminotransferase class I/II-fold pyridoxal phosphate-dependent enzyme n=1 Tax=Pelomicrobium sp. G1 TaxID=3452920 RepID=UPI003F75E59A